MSVKISASKYAENAVVANQVGQRMLSRLEWLTFSPKLILDAGARVGFGAAILQEYYPHATIIALDHARSFLHLASKNSHVIRVQGNVFQSPIANHCVDLVFANFLLPWCHDIPALFREWRRILRPNSLLIFSALGPDTLKELQNEVSIIPNLPDMHDLGDILSQGGWVDPVLDIEFLTLNYQTTAQLIHELTLTEMIETSKKPLKNLQASFEIIYGLAWTSDLSRGYAADSEGVARIPLSEVRYNKKI